MNLNLLALGVATFGSISLGIAVYQRTPDRVWNRLFAVYATLTGVWAFCNFMIMSAETAAEAAAFVRLSHPLAIMSICTVIDFAWVFPERIDYVDRKRRLRLYAVGIIFGSVFFAPGLIESIQIAPGVVNVIYGPLLVPFALFVIGALAYTAIVLLRKAIRLEGVQRIQVIWVLVGLAGAHLIAILAILVIPLLWGTTALSGWGATGVILQVIGMGYAIGKHRLMRPSVALRGVGVTVVSAAVVVFLGVTILHFVVPMVEGTDVPKAVVYLFIGVAMGAGLTLVHRWVSSVARMSDLTPPSTVFGASSEMLRTLDSEHLLHLLACTLDDALQPSVVAVYIRAPTGNKLLPKVVRREAKVVNGNGRRPIDLEHNALDPMRNGSLLTRDEVFRFASFPRSRQLSVAMDDWEAEVMAPLIWEDELTGLLVLGPKQSGEMYFESEMRFVADVALQASLAMRNANLYAETEALKDFNARILSQMDNAVVVVDDQQRIVVFNAAAEQLFDIPAAQAVDAPVDLLPDMIINCIRASLGSGRVLSGRHFEIERGEEIVPLACSTSPLEWDSESGHQGAVVVISDLTLIRELDLERQEAERLMLIRTISAGMAHEIRNPLVAIRTFAELAPRRLGDPEFRSTFLTVMHDEVMRIDKLVGDLLTLSKPADAVVEDVDLEVLCRTIMRTMEALSEAKNVRLQLELDRSACVVRGDETRLHQALQNLVSNAIDAEPSGGQVTLTTRHCGDESGGICIMVHNPNSFIDEELADEIWRPFISRKAKGTGLGLAICQTIIEEHQGDIEFESTLEGGTTFIVSLPLMKSRTAAFIGGFK